jgi:CRP-like cAMP-binding protein
MSEKEREQPDFDDLTSFIVTGNAGETIFSEGDTGTEMYIIQKGEIEILKSFGPEIRRLGLLEVGDFFGEMSLLEELPRDASAKALSDYKLLRINHSTFDHMVQENPEIAVRMLRKLSQRLRDRQEADLRADKIAREVLGESEASSPADSEEATPTVARAFLLHEATETRFQLSIAGDTTIGRRDRVTGFTPDIDFTSLDNDRTLSRRHAKISEAENGFYLREEIGTNNGTYVNGKRIATGVPVKLKDGDELRFGLLKTVFVCD